MPGKDARPMETLWRAETPALLIPAVFLLFLFQSFALFAQNTFSDFQFKKVGDVRLKTDGEVDQEFLLNLIEITPNVDILTTSKIRKSIELLYATGNFTNILVDAELAGDRVQLTFILRLIYRFEYVHMEGQLGISSQKIRKKMRLRKLEPYTPEKALRGREDILAVLKDHGYYKAKVTQDVLLHRGSKRAEVTYTIQAGPPAYLGSIAFTGNPHFTREQLVSQMESKPEDRFREFEFNKSLEQIEALYDKHGFLEHKITVAGKEPDPANRMNIEINIDAGKQLVLETVGYDLPQNVVREQIPIWLEHSYNDDTLEEAKRNLAHYMQTEGYYDSKVSWQKDISGENILITYTLEPGIKYEVQKILIRGNDNIPTEEIRELMNTKESGLRAKRLSTKLFEADRERVLSHYRLHGYLFAHFKKTDVLRLPEGKMNVDLEIEEGPQVVVSEIRMKGNTAISTDHLLREFKQRVGEPISEFKVKTDSNYIVALYSDRGYPKVQLESKLLLSQDKKRAVIQYRIEEGEQVFVDRIVISGNYRTKRHVITKNLFFEEDEPFSLRKITESQGQLYSLEIFDRVDVIVPRPDNLQEQQNVLIQLTETKPYTISYGFGYQTFDKLRGVLSLSNRNLYGTDRTATLQLRGGLKEGRVLVSFHDPHLVFHQVNSTLTAFAERRVPRDSFSFERIGIGFQIQKKLSTESAFLQVGDPVPPLKSLFFRYDFEDINTTGTPNLSSFERQFLAIHVSSISGSFVRDARDNIIDPAKGNFLSGDLQYATRLLGSETDFLKFFGQFQYYVPFRKTVIASSLRLGLAKVFDEPRALPLSQRFFAGGGRTIRGFELDTAGPLDNEGQPLGGNALLILNLEYRFPVFGSLGGVVFFDYGNVFPLVADLSLSEMRKTAGLGLRYQTAIGPLTLDWGYKLDRKRIPIRESASEFFISVGHAF